MSCDLATDLLVKMIALSGRGLGLRCSYFLDFLLPIRFWGAHRLRAAIIVCVVVLFVVGIPLQVLAQVKAKRCPMLATENVFIRYFPRSEESLLSRIPSVQLRLCHGLNFLLCKNVGFRQVVPIRSQECRALTFCTLLVRREVGFIASRNIEKIDVAAHLLCEGFATVLRRNDDDERLIEHWISLDSGDSYPGSLIEVRAFSGK